MRVFRSITIDALLAAGARSWANGDRLRPAETQSA